MSFIVKEFALAQTRTTLMLRCTGLPHSLCHIGRGSEQTGNTVTSEFPACVCLHECMRQKEKKKRTAGELEMYKKEKGKIWEDQMHLGGKGERYSYASTP